MTSGIRAMLTIECQPSEIRRSLGHLYCKLFAKNYYLTLTLFFDALYNFVISHSSLLNDRWLVLATPYARGWSFARWLVGTSECATATGATARRASTRITRGGAFCDRAGGP
jgi:hypothetical protein